MCLLIGYCYISFLNFISSFYVFLDLCVSSSSFWITLAIIVFFFNPMNSYWNINVYINMIMYVCSVVVLYKTDY